MRPGTGRNSSVWKRATALGLAAASLAVTGLLAQAPSAAPPVVRLKVCVQTIGSRENIGDLSIQRTFCKRGARTFALPTGTIRGQRGLQGQRGPQGRSGGGTPWWVPVATAFAVALVAAVASYFFAWRFKRGDVDRENAFKAATFIDEAAAIAGAQTRELWDTPGGATACERLLRQAVARVRPLRDDDLERRLVSAVEWALVIYLMGHASARSTTWLTNAIESTQAALVPHLASPAFFRRRPRAAKPSFPPQGELEDIINTEAAALQDMTNTQAAAREKGEALSRLCDLLGRWQKQHAPPRSA
jgi:hypothetical protein